MAVLNVVVCFSCVHVCVSVAVCMCMPVYTCVWSSVKCLPQLLSTLVYETWDPCVRLDWPAGELQQSVCLPLLPALGLQKTSVLSSYMGAGGLNLGPDDCLASTLPFDFCLIKIYFIDFRTWWWSPLIPDRWISVGLPNKFRDIKVTERDPVPKTKNTKTSEYLLTYLVLMRDQVVDGNKGWRNSQELWDFLSVHHGSYLGFLPGYRSSLSRMHNWLKSYLFYS